MRAVSERLAADQRRPLSTDDPPAQHAEDALMHGAVREALANSLVHASHLSERPAAVFSGIRAPLSELADSAVFEIVETG